MAATLKAKLDVERPALKILGACNPTFAHEALKIDPSASLMIPCNVVLEPAAGGGTRVSIVDPRQLMAGDDLLALSQDAAVRLTNALDSLAR